MKFHHIGIFVKNLKVGESFFSKNFNIKRVSKTITDKNLKVKVKFLYDYNNICYELVAPFGKKNPVDKVIKIKSRILNHIAYTTNHFDKKIQEMRKKNFAPISKPMIAKAFNRRVIFFLTPLNFIIELIEK